MKRKRNKRKSPSLFSVIYKKEKVFWNDMIKITRGEFSDLSKVLGIFSLMLIHYGGVSLRILFEWWMKFFNRPQFERNIRIMNKKVDLELATIRNGINS